MSFLRLFSEYIVSLRIQNNLCLNHVNYLSVGHAVSPFDNNSDQAFNKMYREFLRKIVNSFHLFSVFNGFKWSLVTTALETCGTGLEADFWYITRNVSINPALAEVIYVEIEVEYEPCYDGTNDVKCYSHYFEVYIYPGKYVLNDGNITSSFKPLRNITIKDSPTTTLTGIIQTFSFNTKNYSQGATLAFRSKGACGKVFRMKMYYYYCEETFNKGIKFKRTSSPGEGCKNVTGSCSENSVSLNNAKNLDKYCCPNGTWSEPKNYNLECFCLKGYALHNTDGPCSSKLYILQLPYMLRVDFGKNQTSGGKH